MKYILAALFIISSFSLSAQNQVPRDLSVNDMLKEIMQTEAEGKNTKIVLWFPQEYWDVCANSDPSFKRSTVELIKETFEEYTIVVAVNGDRIEEGNHTYASYEATKKNIRLIDATNHTFAPLEDKDLSTMAIEFKKQVAPLFAKMLGEMGSHAYLFFFKTGKENNTNYASQKGSFKIVLDKATFPWSLPLTCLMPAKTCPTDQAKMHGDWLYCPYHGTKLTN